MTTKELKLLLRKEEKHNIITNYGICLFIFSLAVWMSYKTYMQYNGRILFASIYTYVMSIYGFWRIDKQFTVKEIKSAIPVEQKVQILNKYLHTYKWKRLTIENSLYKGFYTGSFLTDIHIIAVFDEHKILLHATTARYSNGFIDIGTSHRALKKVHKYFIKHLQEQQDFII